MIYSVQQKPIASPDDCLQEPPSRSSYAIARSSPHRTFSTEQDMPQLDEDHEQLAARILARIESRLPCRIRQLTVYATDNAVVLAGQCSTYYTKQVAQHAAMGVLEYERLINNIDVRPAK